MFEVLKFLYYSLGIVAILYEVWCIQSFKQLDGFRNKIKAFSKEAKASGKENVNLELSNVESTFGCLQALYMIWGYIGLFTSQWLLFSILILISFLHGLLWSKTWNTIDSLLSIGLIGFAILNTYHFHINLQSGVWSYISG